MAIIDLVMSVITSRRLKDGDEVIENAKPEVKPLEESGYIL